jgi:hypothetical protein
LKLRLKITSVLAVGGIVLLGGPSSLAWATAQTGSASSLPPEVLSPLGDSVTNSGCPASVLSDWGVLVFSSGHTVNHDSSNKNGDWGGGTIEGDATITLFTNAPANPDDPTSLPSGQDKSAGPFTGHLTEWFGGGNNSRGQGEGGFTFSFHGVSSNGMTVDVQQHQHQTMSAANGGTPTANAGGGSITCS